MRNLSLDLSEFIPHNMNNFLKIKTKHHTLGMTEETINFSDFAARIGFLREHEISPQFYDCMVEMSVRIADCLHLERKIVLAKYTMILRKIAGKKIKTREDLDAIDTIAEKMLQDYEEGRRAVTVLDTETSHVQKINQAMQRDEASLHLGSIGLTYDSRDASLEWHLTVNERSPMTGDQQAQRREELTTLLREAKMYFPEAKFLKSKTWLNAVPKLIPWYDLYVWYEKYSGQPTLHAEPHDMQSMSSWWQILKSDGTLRHTILEKMRENIDNLHSESDIPTLFPTATLSLKIPLEYVRWYFGV